MLMMGTKHVLVKSEASYVREQHLLCLLYLTCMKLMVALIHLLGKVDSKIDLIIIPNMKCQRTHLASLVRSITVVQSTVPHT